jgi:hypothetical protein
VQRRDAKDSAKLETASLIDGSNCDVGFLDRHSVRPSVVDSITALLRQLARITTGAHLYSVEFAAAAARLRRRPEVGAASQYPIVGDDDTSAIAHDAPLQYDADVEPCHPAPRA